MAHTSIFIVAHMHPKLIAKLWDLLFTMYKKFTFTLLVSKLLHPLPI